MHRSAIVGVIAAAALALAATDASAQRRTQLGIAAGASVPVGDLAETGSGVSTGFHVRGQLEISGTATSPIGFRLEGAFDRFGAKSNLDYASRIISGTGNLMLGFPSASTITPYIIGGVGVYNSKATGDDVPDEIDSSTDFGINAGAGVKFALSGFSTFAELRFHNVFTEGSSAQFIPIVFGISF